MIQLNLSGEFSFNENLYNYGLILSQTVGTTINLFTLCIIYVYRGAEMRSYRWHLFLYQLFSTLLDFSMDTLAAPVFFFPHMAGTCTGWLRTVFGIPTFNVYVFMMTFGGICLHFICFSPLYYRWQIIINDGSYFKFKSKKAKVLFQVLQLAVGTPMLYVFMSLQYEEETGAIEAFKQHNPTDAYLANVDGFYVLNTWRNDMVLWSNICTLFWLVALILLCVFMAIGCARGLDVNREHMSDRTKKMHIRFLKNIFFQSSIPMLLLEIPVLIWFVMMICDLRFPGQQNFTNLTVFSTCIHGAFGSFFVFYLNRSYRIFLQQNVGKLIKGFFKPASVTDVPSVLATSQSGSTRAS